jgi:CBS domain-containing protein
MDPIVPESGQHYVREIMTPDVVKVAPEANVTDVAKILSERGISGVPVVDENERVLGVVTELDLVVRNTRFKLPAFFTLLDATIYLESPAHVRQRLQHMLGITAREIMSAPAITIRADATIEELAEIMVNRKVNPIPVVQGERLVGIVSRADVVRAMARGARD